MDEPLVNSALLVFLSSLLIGPLLGALLGWWKGFASGIAAGCLVIGLTGLSMAGWVALGRYGTLAGTESTQGTLIEFVSEKSRDADGKVTSSLAPIVEYTTPNGQTHRVKALGGSQRESAPGATVEVRFQRDDPTQAVVADFQNMWGIVMALGIFGLLPTMFGLFFVAEALGGDRRGRASLREATPAQLARRTRLTVIANVVFVGGFVISFLGDDLMRSLGAGFITIGCGALLHFVAQSLPPPAMPFQSRFIFAIVGVGFLAFGAMASLLAG